MKSGYFDDVVAMFKAGDTTRKAFIKRFNHFMDDANLRDIELGGRIYGSFTPDDWKQLWERSMTDDDESWKLSFMVYWEMGVLFKECGDDGNRIQKITDRILKGARHCSQEEKEQILKQWIKAAYSMRWSDFLNPMAVFYDMACQYAEYSEYDRKLIVSTFLGAVVSAHSAGIEERSMARQERFAIQNNWISEYIRKNDVDMPYKKNALAEVVKCMGDAYIKEQDSQIKKNRNAVRFGLAAFVLSLGFLGISAGLYIGGANERREQYLGNAAVPAMVSEETGGTGIMETIGADTVPAGIVQTQASIGEVQPEGDMGKAGLGDGESWENSATGSNAMVQAEDSEEEVDFSQTKSIIIMETMIIRRKPSTEAERIGKVPSGDRVEAMGKKGDWLKIRYTGSGSDETIEGYIRYPLPKRQD